MTSVSSLTMLNAKEMSKNSSEDGTRQLRPILKQTRKNNIFDKRYSMMNKNDTKSFHLDHVFLTQC